MIKKLGWLLMIGMILGGCDFAGSKSGIEIISYPSAQVLIDGQEMGMTPYKNNSLKPGKVEVKLISGQQQWLRQIHLENNANTVVNWEFGQGNGKAGGYVLYLEPTGDNNKSGFLVSSVPDKAAVTVDGEIKTLTPGKIDDIGEGDKQVTVSYPGFKNIIVYIKAIKGYQLVLESELAKEMVINVEEDQGLTPTGTGLTDQPTVGQIWITIKETETGWLRVRDEASAEGKEIKRINSGEKYRFLEEKNSWYKIDLGDGKNGWISAKYAAKS